MVASVDLTLCCLLFFFKLKPSLYVELDDDGAPSSSGSAVKLYEISPSSHLK